MKIYQQLFFGQQLFFYSWWHLNIWVTSFCMILKYDKVYIFPTRGFISTMRFTTFNVLELSSPIVSSWTSDTYLKDTCQRSSTASIVGLIEWSWFLILFWAWRNDLFHGFGIISILQDTKRKKGNNKNSFNTQWLKEYWKNM